MFPYRFRMAASPALALKQRFPDSELLISGVLGIYFCATDFVAYSGSARAFIIKALCFLLSSVCVFLCMMAAVFPGIHGHRIPTYSQCKYTATKFTCVCVRPFEGFRREYQYNEIIDCETVTTSVKDILILLCALNAVGSGVCLWFVTLLWKKRYEQFHSGLRFYSYSASIPPHP
ncbi:hypothetical protein LSH36_188g05040 [Paralvinella palmiformis]|uniref:Uncharacterized protein n=1 Tax=Paralvinella palmiformis TaxID=53620 RepID=A0AAD9N792_9ANNE|nr:hypothetical protein LSH36_188g05040 [Paralvinella palmiformis]